MIPVRVKNRAMVAALVAVVAAMLTLVSFSVPLYRLFCAATGFGGTTGRAAAASDPISGRSIVVRFAADVAPGLAWRFEPAQPQVKIRLGEETLVFFTAQNLTDKAIVGHATFNVAPSKAGLYFKKIQCFCFSEERLGPRQTVEMPVDFFVDPQIASNPGTRDVDTITLAYTFFRSVEPGKGRDLARFDAAAPSSPARGEKLFAERCAACHSLDRNKAGPALGGVVDRRAGTAPGYDYSPALRRAALRWSEAELDRWLAGPQQVIPGARMPVRVLEPATRRDIIAYLRTSSPHGNSGSRSR